MLDIVLLIFFTFMTFRVVQGVVKEASIFKEFNQSKKLAPLSLLFPVAPILLLTLIHRLGWLPSVILASCCYLPSLLISQKQAEAFQRSGTDRTKKAEDIVNQAFLASMVGLIYIGIFLVFIFVGSNV
ncbi:MAG: hypothetical protein ACAH12_06955 [Methylophilaceae bacterium]